MVGRRGRATAGPPTSSRRPAWYHGDRVRSLPKRAPRGEEHGPESGSGPRGLSRRATLRPEIRAAIALEEAGELQEAARVFEYAGEHAQAAALRLEHARTLRDPRERLDGLREGCARNTGDTAEGRTLHLALAEGLLEEAATVEDVASRRSLELEAARALEEADEGGRAGELYESLGLLRRAARAYERSGEITRLELVLELLERQEQVTAALRSLERDVDHAIAQGRRRYAHELLIEHVRGDAKLPGRTIPPASLVSRLQLLESRLLMRDRVELRWGADRVTAVRGAPRFRIGRAPDAELSLPGARLSRHHAELSVDGRGERPRLQVMDLGSKVGSFWCGEPLSPGEPVVITEPGELALGTMAPIEIHPVLQKEGGAIGGLLRQPGTERWMLFLPRGGPLWLSPDIRVPATLLFDRGYVVLDFATGVATRLGDQPLGSGAAIELMLHDRVSLVDAPLSMEVLA